MDKDKDINKDVDISNHSVQSTQTVQEADDYLDSATALATPASPAMDLRSLPLLENVNLDGVGSPPSGSSVDPDAAQLPTAVWLNMDHGTEEHMKRAYHQARRRERRQRLVEAMEEELAAKHAEEQARRAEWRLEQERVAKATGRPRPPSPLWDAETIPSQVPFDPAGKCKVCGKGCSSSVLRKQHVWLLLQWLRMGSL